MEVKRVGLYMIKLITNIHLLNKTSVYLDGDDLIRRSGIIFIKRVRLSDVIEINCINRDAVTHDEIMISFSVGDGVSFYISEFDIGFVNVMNELSSRFAGLIDFKSLSFDGAFSSSSTVLWKK